MTVIDPTARIDTGATIGRNVTVGAYCTIGPHVTIGDECRLIAHVHLTGHTTIGSGTVIYPFASLGTPPQSVKYRGGPTCLEIGSNCDIRECVTINTGTEDAGSVTKLGNRCFLMATSHVGHDCDVGDGVTLVNGVMLGGHVKVGQSAFLGGGAVVHQFVRIGEGAMIAGNAGVAADVIPFAFVLGYRAQLAGLNVVGLKRRGVPAKDIRRLRGIWKSLFEGPGLFRDRLAATNAAYADDPVAKLILGFIHEGKNRPLMMAHPDVNGSTDDGK